MKKGFDCIQMKRAGQEALRKRLEGLTEEQILAYWAEQSRKLQEQRTAGRPIAQSEAPRKKSA